MVITIICDLETMTLEGHFSPIAKIGSKKTVQYFPHVQTHDFTKMRSYMIKKML